jgi:two-component system, NtrC family, sensor kinase
MPPTRLQCWSAARRWATKVTDKISSRPDDARFGASHLGADWDGSARIALRGWSRLAHSLSAKLIALLLGAMMLAFALLGFVNIRLHKKHLEATTISAAERISDLIKHGTTYHMLRNDREAMYELIHTMGNEPGIVHLRIIDQNGRISFSSDTKETNQFVDKSAEACYGCHAQAQPLAHLDRPDRLRIFRANGDRILGVITPIENQPSCYNAECHFHPASQKVLGVLDADLSLVRADADVKQGVWLMLLYTLMAAVGVSLLIWVFVMRVVGRPIHALHAATEKLKSGDLGYQIAPASQDEIGELAGSFNQMSLQLRQANEEITAWAHTLEERVEQKSAELKRAHDQILHVEKMATIGKMAAVVAHEVNNPLAGILTYAKLMRKWVDRRDFTDEKLKEYGQCLDMIAAESRRCGDLVKNLLMFSRTSPMNLVWADLNQVVSRCTFLVQHQLEHTSVQLQKDLAADLPPVHCDPAQVEQVLLALVMNAIDAMPRGGNLWLRTRSLPQSSQVELQVRDDGCGMTPEVRTKLFEPFVTTKPEGKGVGLGLAISRSIIERHHGTIEVESQLGRGTTFYIFLPVDVNQAVNQHAANQNAGNQNVTASAAQSAARAR